MECLDESTVLALVSGELRDADARDRRAHLARCESCRALVGQVARSLRTADPLSETSPLLGGTAMATTHAAPHASDDDVLDHLDDRAFMERVATGTLLDGRYRIERVLGAGGMGVVTLATHVALNRPVAIKLLHARSLASPEAVARFVREARAAVTVASDHVVRVLDVASLDTGEPYIVMEYLVGRDARAHLAERKNLDVAEVVDIVAQACLGVGRAHRAGIVHRDLKPANLYVLDAPEREVPLLVKVLDFGVSKIRRDEIGVHEVSLTRSTAFLGTPLYMSPEQIRASRDVDARADVWALGCILHELLVGRAPYRRESLGLTCAAILVEEPEALSRSRADVPRAIESIVRRCLEKDRDARFADGFDLAAALAPFASQATREEMKRVLGIDARPTAPPRKRSPALFAALALVPLLGLGAALALRAPSPEALPSAPAIASSSSPPSTADVVPSIVAPAPLPIVSTSVVVVAHAKPQPIVAPASVSVSATVVPSVAASVAPVASPSSPLNPEFGPRK
jgi:serine/threonine protein kinase